jgi:hypothetical protein
MSSGTILTTAQYMPELPPSSDPADVPGPGGTTTSKSSLEFLTRGVSWCIGVALLAAGGWWCHGNLDVKQDTTGKKTAATFGPFDLTSWAFGSKRDQKAIGAFQQQQIANIQWELEDRNREIQKKLQPSLSSFNELQKNRWQTLPRSQGHSPRQRR